MRLTWFILIVILPTLVNAEKVSFKQASLHLNIPESFEKVSEGIAPQTLIRLRVKGKAPTPQCTVSFEKDPELNGLTMRQIEPIIDQLTGDLFISTMSETSALFRSAKLLSTSITYWSGYKTRKLVFSVDLSLMGIENWRGRGFYEMFFTVNKKGIYGLTCGHSSQKKASRATEELRHNILIEAF